MYHRHPTPPILPLLLLSSTLFLPLAAAQTSVTTKPATLSEIEELRAKVKALEIENDLLRSELTSLNKPLPAPATLPGHSDDRPLAGIEGLLQEFPQDQLPGPDEGTNDLRQSLLSRWIQNHAIGRTISLRGKFVSAGAISNGSFQVKISSPPKAPHVFEATLNLPELEAPTVVNYRRGMNVQATGQISKVELNRNTDGSFAITLEIAHAAISG